MEVDSIFIRSPLEVERMKLSEKSARKANFFLRLAISELRS